MCVACVQCRGMTIQISVDGVAAVATWRADEGLDYQLADGRRGRLCKEVVKGLRWRGGVYSARQMGRNCYAQVVCPSARSEPHARRARVVEVQADDVYATVVLCHPRGGKLHVVMRHDQRAALEAGRNAGIAAALEAVVAAAREAVAAAAREAVAAAAREVVAAAARKAALEAELDACYTRIAELNAAFVDLRSSAPKGPRPR